MEMSDNLVESIIELAEKLKSKQDWEDSTTNNRRRPIRCWTCGVEGHVRRWCSQQNRPLKTQHTSQVRQIKIHQYSRQDVKAKMDHRDLCDSISEILEKYRNRRYPEKSTFNRRPIHCWTCGAEGHKKSHCPHNNSVDENLGVFHVTSAKERKLMGCYQTPPLQKIRLQCNGSSLAVPGRICGRRCQMVVDTGSSHTVVRPNIVAHCKIEDTDDKYYLESARGEVIPVLGIHLAEIVIGNKTFKQNVFVADITDDVLLGLDVMTEQDFILDLHQRVLKINDEKIQLSVLKTQAVPTRRVRILEDAIMPPQLEFRAEVTCNQDPEDEGVHMVEAVAQLCQPNHRANKECTDDYFIHLDDRLRSSNEVCIKMKAENDRRKNRYDERANICGLQVDEKVWLFNTRRTKGNSLKLQRAWEGPYTIVTRFNDVVYRIHKNPKAKMKIVHLDRLTPDQERHPSDEVT